jgi:hypothetical protein
MVHTMDYLTGLARLDGRLTVLTPFLAFLLIATGAAQFMPRNRMDLLERALEGIPVPLQGALAGMAIVAIDSLGPSGIAPFIYFQF